MKNAIVKDKESIMDGKKNELHTRPTVNVAIVSQLVG